MPPPAGVGACAPRRRHELESAAGRPVELERENARLLLRLDRFAPELDRRGAVGEDGQLELFAANGAGALPPAPQLPRLADIPAAPPHAVRSLSRCRFRPLLVPLLRRAGRRHASSDEMGAFPAPPVLRQPRSATPHTGFFELVDLSAPVARISSWSVPGIRLSPTRSWSGSPAFVSPRVGLAPHRGTARRAGRAALRVRARRCPAPRTTGRPAPGRGSRSRPRLQDQRARGREPGGDHRRAATRSSASCTRFALLPGRRGEVEVVPLPGAAGRRGVADLRECPAALARGRPLGGDRENQRR